MKNKSLIVAKYEFLRTVKRKGFLFAALLLPLLIMLPLMFTMHYLPSLVPETANEKIENPMAAEKVTIDEQGNIKEKKSGIGGFLVPYALAMLLIFGIITSSGYLMQGIVEEKESRTGELLLSSLSADQLLKGKILGYGSVGLVQIGIWILVGLIMIFNSPLAGLSVGIEISWVFALAILYFILGYFLFAVSIACAASISTSTREAQQTSMIFTMFAIVPLMFAQFIIMAPNSMVAKVLTYFPYTSPFITMMRLPLVEVPFYEIALSIAILIISVGLVTKLSAKIFRMGMLMYGKRANLRDIMGFLKEK